MRSLLSFYSPKFPQVITYMLQSSEYEVEAYVKWLLRVDDFGKVQYRRNFDPTPRAKLLLLVLKAGMLFQILVGVFVIWLALSTGLPINVLWGLAIILSYPLTWPILITFPLLAAKYLVVGPRDKRFIKNSAHVFSEHSATKIAIAGSYGKTTMKELLLTVLGEGKKVAATPANKNVAISHAHFSKNLSGKEEILIIEYGEGAPGDVAHFAEITTPTHAIITGLAPAHLDKYKTLDAAARDIFSLADYLNGQNTYVHQTTATQPYIKDEYRIFNQQGALGWQISNVKVHADHTDFVIQKGTQKLDLSSGLVGRHQVVFLTLVAALAMELGLSKDQVKDGISKTMPFEHRMQPYKLAGAQIIDDTYNGNLEGIRAGTELLKELKAKRKIYVTPGLVDQGQENESVHTEVGRLIASAKPDLVVLMQNSATEFIKEGLKQGNFAGDVRLEDQPLEFYSNLSHFVAAGDLVLMQNDWTDNYK